MKASAEREFTVNKGTRSTAGIMTDRFPLIRLPSSFNGSKEDFDGLIFSLSVRKANIPLRWSLRYCTPGITDDMWRDRQTNERALISLNE